MPRLYWIAPRPGRSFYAPAGALALLLLLAPVTSAQPPAPAAADDGIFVTVPSPITDRALNVIKSTVEQARNSPARHVKKVVFDFNPEGKDSSTPDFGSCYELGKYVKSLSLNGITTVAFVHGKTTGHTVLPALACNDLVMSSDAKIGEVVDANGTLDRRDREVYSDYAGPARAALVAKMYDKNVEVVTGLLNQSTVYLDANRLRTDPEYKQRFQNVVGINPNPVLPAGNVELYTAERALKFGLCKLVKESRTAVAEEYKISPSGMQADYLQGRAPKGCKIDVVGVIDGAMRERVRLQLDEVRARRENVVIFQLECSGGSPEVARELADDIRNLVDADKLPIKTVAFIPDRAPDLATFLALACSEIVMYKGPEPTGEAVLGDFEQYLGLGPVAAGRNPRPKKDDRPGVNRKFILENLKEVAGSNYSPLLIEGMLEPGLKIVRAHNTKTDEYRLMPEEAFEADNRNAPGTWADPQVIKERGPLLKLNATRAKELRVAAYAVDSRDVKDVYPLYGLTDSEVRDAKPHWLSSLAAFLRRAEVSVILIVLAFGCLILELKVPGMTVPGIISALCFVLFFWAQSYLSGQIIYLAVLLFVLGLILIGLEIFVLPGFGVTGISGILLVMVGLGLATVNKMPQTGEEWGSFAASMMRYGISMVGATVLTLIFARYLPKIPYANRLMLIPPADKPDGEAELPMLPGAEQAAALLGAVGEAVSTLRPAGMAKFGEVYVDVVTEGGYIEAGTRIQVIEVEGTRIVVKAV